MHSSEQRKPEPLGSFLHLLGQESQGKSEGKGGYSQCRLLVSWSQAGLPQAPAVGVMRSMLEHGKDVSWGTEMRFSLSKCPGDGHGKPSTANGPHSSMLHGRGN